MLSAALAYALFKIIQLRPGGRPKRGTVDATAQVRLHDVLGSIPVGRVITFAALSEHCELGGGARGAAKAVRALMDQDALPWWRVVRQHGATGQMPPASAIGKRQQQLLTEEGVKIEEGSFPLAEYEWTPNS